MKRFCLVLLICISLILSSTVAFAVKAEALEDYSMLENFAQELKRYSDEDIAHILENLSTEEAFLCCAEFCCDNQLSVPQTICSCTGAREQGTMEN